MRKGIVVCDIENYESGELICMDLLYQNQYHEFKHNIFDNWKDFLKCIVAKDFHYIYAHNGGGWDWLCLVQYLMQRKGMYDDVSIITANGRMIVLNLWIDGKVYKFVDSLNLIRCGLDDAGEKFGFGGKIKFDGSHEELYRDDPLKFLEYLKRDTELLYKVIDRFSDTIYKDVCRIGKLGVTLPATALDIFRTKFLDYNIICPQQPELKQLLRNGYKGGRVECFKVGYYDKIYVYDINSLYLSVMGTIDLPVSCSGGWVADCVYTPCMAGVFTGVFSQPRTCNIPLLMVKAKGEWEGKGTFFAPELNKLLELGGRFEIEKGYIFTDNKLIFKRYADTIYELRMKNKGSVLDEVAKLLGNSLYGKFGINPKREKIEIYGDIEKYRKRITYFESENISYNLVDDENLIVKYEEQIKDCYYENVAIAGMITSMARVKLYEIFNDGTVYCDTDSNHTVNPLPAVSDSLGGYKQEFVGMGVYLGKKIYALTNEKSTKFKVKGLRIRKSKKDKLGCKMNFDSMVRIIGSGKIKKEYQAATTLNEVLNGRQSCRFNTRKRTIQRTA